MFTAVVIMLFILMLLMPCMMAVFGERPRKTEPESVAAPKPKIRSIWGMREAAVSVPVVPEAEPAVRIVLPETTALESETRAAWESVERAEGEARAAAARLAKARAEAAAAQAALLNLAALRVAEERLMSERAEQIAAERRRERAALLREQILAEGPASTEPAPQELPGNHPSLDFPRSRVVRRAA